MKIAFTAKLALSKDNKVKLTKINQIIERYRAQGYKLTLRQLYYQLVVENIIPNKVTEYDKIGDLLTKGRMAGVVDWDAIADRVRVPNIPYCNDGVEDAITDAHDHYRLDRQEGQHNYIEMWVEKDALSEILKRKTHYYHVNLMVNRGYTSTTALYDAWRRFHPILAEGRKVNILYLGDHDPSGLDMIRDIRERTLKFLLSQPEEIADWWRDNVEGTPEEDRLQDLYEYDDEALDDEGDYDPVRGYILDNFQVKHIGLTSAQVRLYNPPPNPAKMSDPRATWYVEQFGRTSWEVDALNPDVLHQIIDTEILALIDAGAFNQRLRQEQVDRTILRGLPDVRSKFERIREVVDENPDDHSEIGTRVVDIVSE